MEAWLELWDLSEERWLDWVRADAIHARHRGAAPSPHDEPDESTVLTEAICSGELVRWADRLAERAVGWSATHPGDGQSAGLADLEASFRAYVQTIATEARLASQLALHRLEWTRVAFRRLTFPDRDQAREGLLALTDDQLSIDELARTARVTVVDRSTLLEDLPAAVADRLRGAPSATPVGPFEVDGGWVLLQVSSRTAPTMTDPQIAERARAEVVRSGLARDARDRIRWIWPR
jgi:hypothetical protein